MNVFNGDTAALKEFANPAPSPKEEAEVQSGSLNNGANAVTAIAIPFGSAKEIGFACDNGLQGLPSARLRVAVWAGPLEGAQPGGGGQQQGPDGDQVRSSVEDVGGLGRASRRGHRERRVPGLLSCQCERRPAHDLRRRGDRGRVHRVGVPGPQRDRQAPPGDPGPGAPGGGGARLRAGRGGPGAERQAQGDGRGRLPARAQGHVGRRVRRGGREPPVRRHHQPGHRGRGAAPRLQPADQLGGGRGRRRGPPDDDPGRQVRRADRARPRPGRRPAGPAGPPHPGGQPGRDHHPAHGQRAR